MITGETLATLLHAVATGYPDRALHLVSTSEEFADTDRSVLLDALNSSSHPAMQARALGDAFLAGGSDQAVVNECYRAAFYNSEHWQDMAANPLYSLFVANRAGGPLDKWVHYFPIYTHHLERFRNKPVNVLEIGVYRGGGLRMLSRYLGPAAKLVGLDIDEAAVRAVHRQFPVVLGDQADPEVLRKLNEDYGPFDVVIDDGGHTMQQQIVTTETLFPLLNDGGVFLVEDCHTSYWASFGGGLRSEGSFIEWTKQRLDDLHSRHDTAIDPNSSWATEVDGVHVYDSVVVLEKARRFRPFNEVVGTSSYLFAARFSEILGNELLATRDAALTQRDELQATLDGVTTDIAAAVAEPGDDPDRENALLRAELQRVRVRLGEVDGTTRELESDLERTRNELLESWQQVKLMRGSVSWRLTSPLRALKRRRRR